MLNFDNDNKCWKLAAIQKSIFCDCRKDTGFLFEHYKFRICLQISDELHNDAQRYKCTRLHIILISIGRSILS